MAYIYCAGPLFNTHERWYLERIAEGLEAAGHRTFLPHRDGIGVEAITEKGKSAIFHDDVKVMDACDLVVALLTGQDQDSGTSLELGYMYAHGKACFGITDDTRGMNLMIWGVCNEGKHIARSVQALIPILDAFLSESPA